MKYINNSHLKSHGLTPTQFKEMYPGVEAISQEIREANKRNGILGGNHSKEKTAKEYSNRIQKYNLKPQRCKHCECIIPYERRENKFCSHSCAASTSNKNREVIYSEEGKEALRKVGLKNKDNLFKSGKKVKVFHHKKCIICNSEYVTKKGRTGRKTCGDKCYGKWRSLNNSKEVKTFGKWGYYQGIYCASSWELAFLIYNKDLGRNIQRCDLTFEYCMNEKEKIYFPDFLMDATIYEVKGRELEDVSLKTQAVLDAGYKIEVVRKKQITPILNLVKKKYGVKDVTELYDKKV